MHSPQDPRNLPPRPQSSSPSPIVHTPPPYYPTAPHNQPQRPQRQNAIQTLQNLGLTQYIEPSVLTQLAIEAEIDKAVIKTHKKIADRITRYSEFNHLRYLWHLLALAPVLIVLAAILILYWNFQPQARPQMPSQFIPSMKKS